MLIFWMLRVAAGGISGECFVMWVWGWGAWHPCQPRTKKEFSCCTAPESYIPDAFLGSHTYSCITAAMEDHNTLTQVQSA